MKKVLVVEDDQITRRAHRRVLRDLGYSVLTTSNGPDGVAIALRERPNLVILDLGLPSPHPSRGDFDGYAVLRWLRRTPATCDIPIVVATSYPPELAKEHTRELGASAYLQKPVKADDLKSTARILMDDF